MSELEEKVEVLEELLRKCRDGSETVLHIDYKARYENLLEEINKLADLWITLADNNELAHQRKTAVAGYHRRHAIQLKALIE